MNETWVLYDRMLIDDELYQVWKNFASGVRIFVLSDSCHSGTVLREQMYREWANTKSSVRQFRGASATPRFKAIPKDVERAAYATNKQLYLTRQWAASGKRGDVDASVLLISGCLDNQLSQDGDVNGLFTEKVLKVWNNGRFSGDYPSFHQQIVNLMPGNQTPNYYKVGAANAAFESQKPFTTETAGAQVTNATGPTIQCTSINTTPDDPPPVFQVDASPNAYYILEVANQAELLNTGANYSQRNDSNFWGSWMEDGGHHIPAS